MPSAGRRLVIVGASLSGLRTAEEARAQGFDGPVTLVGLEEHLPYDRPPLSKQVLTGRWAAGQATLRTKAEIASLGIELCLGDPAVRLEPGQVTLRSGRQLAFAALVIATGAAARRLAGQPEHECIHTLRTLEDSLALAAALDRARSVLVVGGGFIGAEVAVAARAANLDVTVIEALSVPFERALGRQAGQHLAALHRDRGVRVLTEIQVSGFVTSPGAVGVRLADGRVLEADCLLTGIGSTPSISWLVGSGVPVGNGIRCDENGRVPFPGRVYAVGDVAAWRSRRFGDQPRLEHWSSATDQARRVGAQLASGPTDPGGPPVDREPLPYFWSDQYDLRIQLLGRPDLADRVRLLHRPDRPERLLGTYFRRGTLVAALTFGSPRDLALCRPLLESGTDATAVATGLPGFEPVRSGEPARYPAGRGSGP